METLISEFSQPFFRVLRHFPGPNSGDGAPRGPWGHATQVPGVGRFPEEIHGENYGKTGDNRGKSVKIPVKWRLRHVQQKENMGNIWFSMVKDGTIMVILVGLHGSILEIMRISY